MNPIMITYVGFFVAALILAWAGVEVGRRFYKRKKIDTHIMNTWVPLQPSSSDTSAPSALETENGDQEEPSRSNHHSRSQQNGHYSESKKI